MTVLLAAMLLAAGLPAKAQIADLVQITTIDPALIGGCYAGTAGSDATIFLRNHANFGGCDFSDFNDDLCITRREFAGDQPGGTTISNGDSALLRPSVNGDGAFAWYSTNLGICFIQTDLIGQDVCETPPGDFVHSLSINPQGNRVGMVPRDLFDINVPANVIQVRLASFPSYTLLESYQFNNPLLFPESLDFMATSPWIVFDATNDQQGGGDWGLYLLDRANVQMRTLAAPVPGWQLRNPVFAKTSDQVIAFDAVEIATGFTTILTANIVTGDVREIAQIDMTFGMPSFSGDDSFLIYNREDAAVYTTASLKQRALATDRISPMGAEQAFISDGGYGAMYRRGTFDTTATSCPIAGPGGVGPSLTVMKNSNESLIDLSWSASCSAVGSDYSIHEGTLGNFYSHDATDCSTAGMTSSTGYSPAGDMRYFLIVPVSSEAEGGYGRDSSNVGRPASPTPCQSVHVESTCS